MLAGVTIEISVEWPGKWPHREGNFLLNNTYPMTTLRSGTHLLLIQEAEQEHSDFIMIQIEHLELCL